MADPMEVDDKPAAGPSKEDSSKAYELPWVSPSQPQTIRPVGYKLAKPVCFSTTIRL